MDTFCEICVNALKMRSLKNGGFSPRADDEYRSDSTAWALMALNAAGISDEETDFAKSRLQKDQLTDGRIVLSSEHPHAYWPTFLAVFAWQGSSRFSEPQSRAIDFLLHSTGVHWIKNPSRDPVAHDTNIKGWPWIEGTHSWVVPTSLSLLALKATGYKEDERALEAVRMIIDRQLTKGGWNYGNTKVFGQELRPMPDCTGIALDALSGYVQKTEMIKSINYLLNRIRNVRSPVSLGWGLLGLGAWGERPYESEKWLWESWRIQKDFGEYETSSVSLLLLAHLNASGLLGINNHKHLKTVGNED